MFTTKCQCCNRPVRMVDDSPIHTQCIRNHWGKHAKGLNASRCHEFKRVVAQRTMPDGTYISTVRLYGHGAGYETMVFKSEESMEDLRDTHRYATREDAEIGHRETVARYC